SLCSSLDNPSLFVLSLLCHDIGKGEGKGHSERGALLANQIANRLGFTPQETDRLMLLVREHLMMSRVAQRRDLNDAKVIEEFGRRVRDSETLQLLYLLTFVDMKGTGNQLWTKWSKSLLSELYQKTLAYLTEGEVKIFGKSEEKQIEGLEEVLEKEEIFVRVNPQKSEGFTEFAVCVREGTPGVFAKIAGAISANRMNILSANIFTTPKGYAVDLFRVDKNGEAITNPRAIQAVTSTIRNVLGGKESLPELFAHVKKGRIEKPVPRLRPPKVVIDNQSSERFTVVEVYAYDRPGLLYDLASALTATGMDISLAKISTQADQASDVFYVSSLDGKKVTDSETLDALQRHLSSAAQFSR
ncbi:MAG TPA: hypothetical protein VJL87_03715, partial [Bdellovibrionota bacterium]|nr:hypothetical protein [Bdellovibrionota bacterium]